MSNYDVGATWVAVANGRRGTVWLSERHDIGNGKTLEFWKWSANYDDGSAPLHWSDWCRTRQAAVESCATCLRSGLFHGPGFKYDGDPVRFKRMRNVGLAAHDHPLTSRACADAAEYPKTQKG